MDVPDSMQAELATWNEGAGIDLEGWASCMGNYSLAVGYITLFWPEFVEFEGYIMRKGFCEESLRSFENQSGSTRKSVEWVMNHLHISDIHCNDQLSADKAMILGRTLKEIYEARLARQFPHLPCIVEFYAPDERDENVDYQISFWQKRHEETSN